jgi:regulator of protease activity HflC (stomatin/prohibitin superfamily)
MRLPKLPKIPLPNKVWSKRLGIAFAAAATGYSSYNYVGPDQFAIRETLGSVTSKEALPPGLYFHLPFVQYTHSYQSGVQKISFNAGCGRFNPFVDSTADQNELMAQVTLQYKVTPDIAKLSLHRWSMDGWMMADGYWLISGMMNDSANAVFGKRTMAETIANPARFAAEFAEDVKFRLEQNNVPVEIESIEVHGFKTTYLPTRTVSYEAVRKPQAAPKP